MWQSNVYLFFQSEYEEAIVNAVGKSAVYAQFLNYEPLTRNGVSWIEVESGPTGILSNTRQKRTECPEFLLSYFTPIWKNRGGLIRQKVEIKEDECPPHTAGEYSRHIR